MKQAKKKNLRRKTGRLRPESWQKSQESQEQQLVRCAQIAEQEVLPLLIQQECNAEAALGLLAHATHSLVAGRMAVTVEEVSANAEQLLILWKRGEYQPSARYPFSLEETTAAMLE
jgi:hypothetical protein